MIKNSGVFTFFFREGIEEENFFFSIIFSDFGVFSDRGLRRDT